MLIYLFFMWTAYAAPSEKALIKTFDKTPAIYEKFLSDTMKYRAETEEFNEKEFEPSVESMIVLLGEKKCRKCVLPYLKGLSNLEGSASEALTDQLKRIIAKHPELLNSDCKKMDKIARKKLSVRFSDAINFLSEENKLDRRVVASRISACL